MNYKVITKCPICNNSLKVTRLKCFNCNTVIENEFEFSKFDCLTKEQLYFIEIFLKCRGSIKEVEKELGISYPTVRAKLDEVISSLGYTNDIRKQEVVSNSKILEDLESGKITAEEAIKILNE